MVEPGYKWRNVMSSKLNNHNATAVNDAELERVSGGGEAGTRILSPVERAAQEVAGLYIKNHPIHLGPFPPPHVDIPKIG
jgi:predicted glycosyltransferase